MIDVRIEPLTPERRDDYLAYFDHDAFADNPEWAACYCRLYFCPTREEWGDTTAEVNRAAMHELIGAGRVHGYLAYRDGKPVAWCNAAPLPALLSLPMFLDYHPAQPERIGAVACFNVTAPLRGQGIARQMLDAALRGFAAQGLAYAEGYPRKGDDHSCAEFWPGPMSLYRAAGFEPVRELKHRVVMRKTL